MMSWSRHQDDTATDRHSLVTRFVALAMYIWSHPLGGSASDRNRVNARSLAEKIVTSVAFAVVLSAAAIGPLGVALGLAAGVAVLWLIQPALGCVIAPRVRCSLSDIVRRLAGLAGYRARMNSPTPCATDPIVITLRVSLARAADRRARVCAVITARLHGLTHICALRARLTTAIAAGC